MVESQFQHGVKNIQLGTGYIVAQDQNNNMFAWGDNYAGQLGTRDDIHRDEPTLIKSLAEVQID